MAEVDDGYDSYYANRLWRLLPEIYRARDSDDPAATGPLQELISRIGAQVAVVRRSIDRLWADQSIETSDDWVIPYIGDLLRTNLVNGLDAAGQRLDVAKTIHYRRRKGTLAILEELANDVTGWSAHVVEGFRRLSRTRHGLDPPVGVGPLLAALPVPCLGSASSATATTGERAAALLAHEGLLGRLTATPVGGFANLRSVHGANLADSPFDEYFHTADLRLGRDAVGRYGVPKLLVFLWRLQSFAIEDGTPVPVTACPGQYVFDPTGREVPLFLPGQAPPEDFADTWTSASEWQVPGPLSNSLQQALAEVEPGSPPQHTYPGAEELPSLYAASAGAPLEPLQIEVWPELGRFAVEQSPPTGPLSVSYQYGFPAAIGAGPYDRTLLGDPPVTIAPEHIVTGGGGLDAALQASGGEGTVTINDSSTYESVADVGSTASPIGSLLVRGGPEVRPVVRLPLASPPADRPLAWVFTGGGETAELTLDGLLISGGDIILRGAFASVRLTGCTVDPGTIDPDGIDFAGSVDGRPLTPGRIWIEADPAAPLGAAASIAELSIDHCVLGPIRTRNGGAVQSLTISDSIIQGIARPPSGDASLADSDVYDPELLARAVASQDPVSQLLAAINGGPLSESPPGQLIAALNAIITRGASIYSPDAFAGIPLPPEVSDLLAQWSNADIAALNRSLIEAAYPVALSPAALALSSGTVALRRVSVIGRAYVHRLQASDSILAEFAVAEDPQDGCVRFSAISQGSRVPRPYRSVSTAAQAALFTSDAFGEPAYGQLLQTADRSILDPTPDLTITTGSETGSEMGAFCSELAPIKERGLLTKYAEYMPLGLTPVVVHVT